jgi:hypothetical protein
MIKIFRDDTGEEIFFDGTINLTLFNPLFNDIITHSLNVKIRNTRHNRHVFDYIFMPEVRATQIEFAATINIDNTLILKGSIKLTNTTKEYLDFYFVGQNNFWGWADRTNMRDLTVPWMGLYRFIHNYKAFDNFPVEHNYANILNANTSGLTTTEVPSFNMGVLINAIFNNYGLSVVKNDVVSDSSLSHIELASLNSNSGFSCVTTGAAKPGRVTDGENDVYNFYSSGAHGLSTGDIIYISSLRHSEKPPLSHPPAINIIELPNHALTGIKSYITVIDANNFTLDDAHPSAFGSADNDEYWLMATYYETIIERNDKITENNRDHFPDMSVKNFLIECEKLTGTKIFVNESNSLVKVIKIKTIIENNDFIDISSFCGLIETYEKLPKNGYLLSFDGTTDEYLDEQVNKDLDLTKIKTAVTTVAQLPMTGNSQGDIRLVTTLDHYYIWKQVVFTGLSKWEFYSQNYLDKKDGNGEFTINCSLVPLTESKLGGTTIKTNARVDKEVSFLCFGQTPQSDFRPYLYYLYQQVQYCIRKRRLAIAADGTNEINMGAIDLDWNSEYGLYNQLYKEWVDFMVNNYGEEEREINWPLYMLNDIDWTKKYRNSNMLYYVKSIEIDASAKKTTIGNTVLVPAIH